MWNSRIGKPPTPPMSTCASSFFNRSLTPLEMEERTYLIDKSNLLLNDLGELELQKQYYRNKLHTEVRNGHDELQQCLKSLTAKSHMVVNLEQQLERERKQLRLAADDYIYLKNQSENDKELFRKEMETKQRLCQERLQELEHKIKNQHEIQLNKQKEQLTRQFDEALALKNKQIEDLAKASEGIIAEFKKLQDEHKLLLVKIDGMTQEALHKQLRKRDREERERFNQDFAYVHNQLIQRQALKKENEGLKSDVIDRQKDIDKLRKEVAERRTENDILEKRMGNLQQELARLKGQLEAKVPESSQHKEVEQERGDQQQEGVNTDQQYLPIAVPSGDLNMICLIQSLRQFLGDSLLEILGELYSKSTAQTMKGKKQSASLNVFTLNAKEMKETRREVALTIYCFIKLQEILKLYYPAALHETEVVTLKEGFIRTCLEECAGLRNNPHQQLFRLLELAQRIRAPLNHTNTMANLSDEGRRLVQSKVIESSARVFIE